MRFGMGAAKFAEDDLNRSISGKPPKKGNLGEWWGARLSGRMLPHAQICCFLRLFREIVSYLHEEFSTTSIQTGGNLGEWLTAGWMRDGRGRGFTDYKVTGLVASRLSLEADVRFISREDDCAATGIAVAACASSLIVSCLFKGPLRSEDDLVVIGGACCLLCQPDGTPAKVSWQGSQFAQTRLCIQWVPKAVDARIELARAGTSTRSPVYCWKILNELMSK